MASGHGQGGMSFSMKFIRLLIVLLNVAFCIAGLTLICIGCYVVKDPKMQQLRPLFNPSLTTDYYQSYVNLEIFSIAVIVFGAVLLVIGFLGCCGALKGFRFLHVIYALILGLLIAAQIAMVVAFCAYQTAFKGELVDDLRKSIETYYVGPPINNNSVTNPVSLAWDFAQYNLQCCGAISKNDFLYAKNWSRADPYANNDLNNINNNINNIGNAVNVNVNKVNVLKNLSVPFTCCPLGGSKSWTQLPTTYIVAEVCATTGVGVYNQGCYDRLIDLLSSYQDRVMIGGFCVGCVEVFAFIFAILLYCRKVDYVKV